MATDIRASISHSNRNNDRRAVPKLSQFRVRDNVPESSLRHSLQEISLFLELPEFALKQCRMRRGSLQAKYQLDLSSCFDTLRSMHSSKNNIDPQKLSFVPISVVRLLVVIRLINSGMYTFGVCSIWHLAPLTTPGNLLGRTPSKWPILCRVGRKPSTQLVILAPGGGIGGQVRRHCPTSDPFHHFHRPRPTRYYLRHMDSRHCGRRHK